MYKRIVKLQKEHIKTHHYYKILDLIKKNIRHCKKRGLTTYHLPSVLFGIPQYNIHDLYEFLKKELEEEYTINIIDEQLQISWDRRPPEVAQEIPIIYSKIEKKIEHAIKYYKNFVIYKIPALIDGVPLYSFSKASKTIIKMLENEGFTIEILSGNEIKITWPEKRPCDIPRIVENVVPRKKLVEVPSYIKELRVVKKEPDYRVPVIKNTKVPMAKIPMFPVMAEDAYLERYERGLDSLRKNARR